MKNRLGILVKIRRLSRWNAKEDLRAELLEQRRYPQSVVERSRRRQLKHDGKRMTNEDSSALSSNEYMELELDGRLEQLASYIDKDVLVFIGPIYGGIDDLIRYNIEANEDKKSALAVVIETDGGLIEVSERIANTLRHHYSHVDFYIPNYAMSAGTVLVMSGDAIYMDYYSMLGPIDPQIERYGSPGPVPALGYLEKYDQLIDRSSTGDLTTAELTYLVEKFDPAELHRYEQARDLSIELLKKWLVEFKFKNWSKTASRKKKVTLAMKRRRAGEIAKRLNDTKRWKSHGRGLTKDVLIKDLNLKIDDFAQDPDLNSRLKSYYRLLKDYMGRRRQEIVIHSPGKYFAV